MKRYIRLTASLAVAAGLLAACAAAATPVPTAAPTPVPPVPSRAPAATPDSTPAVVTPVPAASPTGPADPKAPAFATGTGIVSLTKDVTRTADGDCERVGGGIVEGTETSSDPRLTGSNRFEVNGVGCGAVGFEYGTMRIENAAGAWEGFCSGGIWNNENASDLACWLVGSGAYEGMTTYAQMTSAGEVTSATAVILPMPAPKQ